MKKTILAACCVAFVGGTTAAFAQFSGPPLEQSANAPMDANAKIMTKKKKTMMKGNMQQGGESKDGMGMQNKGGMSK